MLEDFFIFVFGPENSQVEQALKLYSIGQCFGM